MDASHEEIETEIDNTPVELVLYCQECGDPCVRMQVGSRTFVHYDEVISLEDGGCNYDHACVVPLYEPEVIDVQLGLDAP